MESPPLRVRLPVLLLGLLAGGCSAWQATRPPAEPMPTPSPRPEAITQALELIPLPGELDDVPVFNSNSPEVVDKPGILLSTLQPPPGASASAYLPYLFEGRYALFSHHIARDAVPGARVLYLGLVVSNPARRWVHLAVQGSSYLSQPDAVFVPLPAVVADPAGALFAGPGDRVAVDRMHGRTNVGPLEIDVPPRGTSLVTSWPVPTNVSIPPPVNGRTTWLDMTSDGALALSELAVFAARTEGGAFVPPGLPEYVSWLASGSLAGPRESTASPLTGPASGSFRYGRVAGVSVGDRWTGKVTSLLAAPLASGEVLGLPISTVELNRLGTGQVQSARLIRRYPDAAYRAHGNYGVTYDLLVPLVNRSSESLHVDFALREPAAIATRSRSLVTQRVLADARYQMPPARAVMFRGPVRAEWIEAGREVTRDAHVVLHAAEMGEPFASVSLSPQSSRSVRIQLIYPADATPPQLLTVQAH